MIVNPKCLEYRGCVKSNRYFNKFDSRTFVYKSNTMHIWVLYSNYSLYRCETDGSIEWSLKFMLQSLSRFLQYSSTCWSPNNNRINEVFDEITGIKSHGRWNTNWHIVTVIANNNNRPCIRYKWTVFMTGQAPFV